MIVISSSSDDADWSNDSGLFSSFDDEEEIGSSLSGFDSVVCSAACEWSGTSVLGYVVHIRLTNSNL